MNAIVSVFLFGFVHSGAKLILETGIGLLPFCFLYSGFRLVVQLPYILKNKLYIVSPRKQVLLLTCLGLVGAALQLCEFSGIDQGISVGAVTFLIYSYPLWSILLSLFINREKVNFASLGRVLFAVVGISFIIRDHLQTFEMSISLLFPIAASFLMALWISLSSLAKQRNLDSWSLSFYYDLFSFAALLIVFFFKQTPSDLLEFKIWLSSASHLVSIAMYSVFFGIVPNILFYNAMKGISAFKASLLLLFEPVISSVIALFLWNDSVGPSFWFGAALIVGSNLTYNFNVKKLFRKVRIYEEISGV